MGTTCSRTKGKGDMGTVCSSTKEKGAIFDTETETKSDIASAAVLAEQPQIDNFPGLIKNVLYGPKKNDIL